MSYNSEDDTVEHIARVQLYMRRAERELASRAAIHDMSKLGSAEKPTFDRMTPRLRELAYGSAEYAAALEEMRPALEHHYRHNKHHPEHHERGVRGMTLLDLIEMLCDWRAASERHADGDIHKSVEINVERFGIPDGLADVLRNTARAWWGQP